MPVYTSLLDLLTNSSVSLVLPLTNDCNEQHAVLFSGDVFDVPSHVSLLHHACAVSRLGLSASEKLRQSF